MLRVASIFMLLAGLWLGLTAFWVADPGFNDGAFAVNTTIAHYFHLSERPAPDGMEFTEVDSTTTLRLLMLNYSAYDSAYSGKMRRNIQRQFPAASIQEFWEGSPDDLATQLQNNQVVVVAYPSNGTNDALHAYGNVLHNFVRQGGAVLLTGTHEFAILQQFGLFDLDFGYFCKDPDIHENLTNHPVMAGTPEDFTLPDYAYPLDISDPGFVTLADVRGYPVVGYKTEGLGKIVYLGFEYYYDEPVSTRLLGNAIRWVAPRAEQPSAPVAKAEPAAATPVVRRSEEYLYAGGTKKDVVDLKIYPNPYAVKASLEFELTKTTAVSIEMTDEVGRPVAELLRQRNLGPGSYYFDLPNLAPGVYFVKCRCGEVSTVRKVVKVAEQ